MQDLCPVSGFYRSVGYKDGAAKAAGLRHFVGALQAIFPHFLDQGGTPELEAVGGVRHDAAGIFQRLFDQVEFHAVDVYLEIEAVARQSRHGQRIEAEFEFRRRQRLWQLLALPAPKFFRQIVSVDHPERKHDDQAFLEIGEFAHIARPVIVAQRNDGLRGQAHRAALFVFEAGDEFVDQQRDVFLALTQRRHLDGKHDEAVVESLAEVAFGNLLFESAMGGGDDAHVGMDRLVTAHPLEHPFLQHPQQFDLHVQAPVADFIEKQAAAFGELEAALTGGDRAGVGAFLMAEQFAFQQFGRYGAAVDRHEGFVTSVRMVVKITGHHFLTSTGLAEYQHRGLGVRHLLDQFAHLTDAAAVADQAAKQFRRALRERLLTFFTENLRLLQRAGELPVFHRRIDADIRTYFRVAWKIRKGVAAQYDKRNLRKLAAKSAKSFERFIGRAARAQQYRTYTAIRHGGSPIGIVTDNDVFVIEKMQYRLQLCTAAGVRVDDQND